MLYLLINVAISIHQISIGRYSLIDKDFGATLIRIEIFKRKLSIYSTTQN